MASKNFTKNIENIHERTEKLIAVMEEKGLNVHDAYAIVNEKGVSKSHIRALNRKIQRYSLTHPKRVKKAAETIDSILASEPVIIEKTNIDREGNIIKYFAKDYPSFTDKREVVKMIVDRNEPVSKESGDDRQAIHTFTQINISNLNLKK